MQTNSAKPRRPGNDQAMSYEEFYRELFAGSPGSARPAASGRPERFVPYDGPALSTEEFYRELFAGPQKPLALGPRPGLEPPALPARFRRVRGGDQLVSYELLVGEDGRISAKHESVAGRASYFIYEYDDTGHLLRAWRDGKLAEEYAYDAKGARISSWNAKDGQWKYGYDDKGRLTAAGPWRFSYAEDGSLREAWTPERSFFLGYNQEGGLSRIVLPSGKVLRSESVAPGLPIEKYLDAAPVESLTWRSPLQVATWRDWRSGVKMQFHYTGQGRLPQAVTVQTPQGVANYLLGYDQVGSLKAVAAMDGENEGRVVKVVDYDAFGNILADSNPGLFMPIAFAGGLCDRFTGLIRFCHRDYDPMVGRFTAPDPLGDTGGDHDLYDYCVDEPVGRVDPEGLKEGIIDAAVSSLKSGWDSLMGMFKSDTPPSPKTETQVLKEMDTVSRDVDSALGKVKGAINSVKPELEDLGKAGDLANKITLPQEATEEAIRIGNKVGATKSRSDYLLEQMGKGNETAALEMEAKGLPEHSKSILETPGEFLRFMWDKYSPFPAPPKPKDDTR